MLLWVLQCCVQRKWVPTACICAVSHLAGMQSCCSGWPSWSPALPVSEETAWRAAAAGQEPTAGSRPPPRGW